MVMRNDTDASLYQPLPELSGDCFCRLKHPYGYCGCCIIAKGSNARKVINFDLPSDLGSPELRQEHENEIQFANHLPPLKWAWWESVRSGRRGLLRFVGGALNFCEACLKTKCFVVDACCG